MAGGTDLDFDSVEFARHWDKGWKGGIGVLGVKVDSREKVDEICADLASAGNTSQLEPYDAFWRARYAVIEDPDGNPVIMSPLDPARRTDPGFPQPPRSSSRGGTEGFSAYASRSNVVSVISRVKAVHYGHAHVHLTELAGEDRPRPSWF